ncbi:MAG: lamin tail domain-containing protein [Candidatus Pacebacteria bacterium]|nr:lamin tail domain-containing protein [Candidatus Paceibacterota bacterium]
MAIRTISNIIIFILLFSFNFAYAQDILINEIAWMGTKSNSNDEWIELYNKANIDISLDGYSLFIGEKEIPLEGIIKANNFYLLERTDDSTLPTIKADLIYTGSLKNTGTKIILKKDSLLIDEANFENGWTAGNNDTKQTAERIEDFWQTSEKEEGSPSSINIKKVAQAKDNNSPLIENTETKKEIPLKTILGISFISATTLVVLRKQITS